MWVTWDICILASRISTHFDLTTINFYVVLDLYLIIISKKIIKFQFFLLKKQDNYVHKF